MAARTTVCDPVHRILDFGAEEDTKQLVKELIDSRPFQRLRRISQLGLAPYVFPGATHSRFAHCLGAGHLARVVTAQLSDSAIRRRQNELAADASLILAAGLLHDVGHGPFSHAFEGVLGNCVGVQIKHEAWTRAIVRSELCRELRRHAISPERLSSVFVESRGKTTRHEANIVPRYIKQIISSQLDVERMDYLVRDSHFSGVPLGHVDLHYLIRCLVPIEHAANDGDHATLGITYKGVKPYEAFALARHLMNRTVYYHPKVAVLELLMEECLGAVMQQLRDGRNAAGIPRSLVALARSDTATSADEFTSKNLQSYLDLTEDHVWTAFSHVATRWKGRARDLATGLLERKVPDYFYVHSGKSSELNKILTDAGLGPTDFALRPKKSKVYGEGADDDVVHVFNESDGTSTSVRNHSFALNAYADKPETETLLVVFNDKKYARIKRAAEHCVSVRPRHKRPTPTRSATHTNASNRRAAR
jgi:HD superfamily phosphohydrolase